MKVLILAKLDANDQIVQDFSTKYLHQFTDIHVLNAIQIPSEIPLQMNGEIIEQCTEYDLTKYYTQQATNQEALASFLPELTIQNKQCMIGDALKMVSWYVKQNNIDLVLSGGHLTTQTEDIFSSTFASHLMKTLSVPYLSIKGDTTGVTDISKIAIVREFLEPSTSNITFLKWMQEAFNSKIILVKLDTPQAESKEVNLNQNMEMFVSQNKLTNVEFLTVKGETKQDAIEHLIRTEQIGILALGHGNQAGSFLHGDLRTDILNHVNLPIYMY